MTSKEFEKVVNDQMSRCYSLLNSKGTEYTPELDRLAHFKKAAAMESITAEQALLGMAAKHFISIADMCHNASAYDLDRWNEKITDAINYLLLLRAMVEEARTDAAESK